MDLYSHEIQEKKKDLQNQHQTIKKMAIGTYIYINNYFKWIKCSNQKTQTEWIQNKTHRYAVYKKPTSDLKTYRLKVRGWKNIFHANMKKKKAGVAVLISGKIDLKIKKLQEIWKDTT